MLVSEDEFLRQIYLDFSLLAGGLHLDNAHDFDDWLLNLHVNWLEIEDSFLDLRVVQIVLHFVKHRYIRVFDDLNVLSLDGILLAH